MEKKKRRHDLIEFDSKCNFLKITGGILKIGFRPFNKCGGVEVQFNTLEELKDLRDKLTDFIITEQMK